MFAESFHCQLGVAKGNKKVVPRTRTGSTANDLSPKVLLQRCMTLVLVLHTHTEAYRAVSHGVFASITEHGHKFTVLRVGSDGDLTFVD